jgi:LPS-assembly protein
LRRAPRKYLQPLLLVALLYPLCVMAADVNITADQMVRDANGVVTATGKVLIQRSGETLEADKVRYDAAGKRIQADGHVHIHSAKADIYAASGEMNTEDKSGELRDAEVQLPDGERLRAKRLLRINEYTFKAFDPVLTTCPKDAETWHLDASEGTLDQGKGMFTAKNARFDFAGVPLFYSPYWQHALRRKSGFLTPLVAFGKRRGTEWALPLYLAPTPDWDATITPHLMTARGFMSEAELRNASTIGREQVQFEGLHDKVLNRSRGRLRGDGRWQLPLDMTLAVKGDEVSDRNYLADFSHNSQEVALRYLTSSAILSQDTEYSSWSLASIYNHDLSTTNNQATLQQYPDFNLNLDLPLFDNRAALHFDHNATRFSNLDGANAARDWRVYSHPYITIPWDMLGGGISNTLSIGSTYTQYWLNNGAVRRPNLSSGEFSFDSSMVFEHINAAHTLRHTIIPRIRYDFNVVSRSAGLPNFDSTLSPLRLSNLFSGNLYSGMDNVERLNRISFLLTNNLETKASPGTAARTVLSISAGAQYNMRSRFNLLATPTSFSNLLGLITFSPVKPVSTNVEGEYDPTQHIWNRIAASLSVDDHAGDTLIASYVANNNTQIAPVSKIIQASGKFSITKRWVANGSINYDIILKYTQQVSLGLTYYHPCWNLGINVYHINRPTGTTAATNTGATLLIGFKGLGSVDSNAQ